MRMHGLGTTPYVLTTYLYWLLIYVLYSLMLMAFGAAVGLNFFVLTSPSLLFATFFMHANVMIAFAFFLSNLFSSPKTAVITA
jgi:hypothetical protein